MARELDKIVVKDKNTTYCYNPSILGNELTATELAAMFDLENYKKQKSVLKVFKGRGETVLVSDVKQRHLIIRHYWRGGLIGKYLHDKFITVFGGGNRAEEEFNLLTIMQKVGLPVPKPVASRMVSYPLYCRNDIIIQEIPGAVSLLEVLKDRGEEQETKAHDRKIEIGDEEIVKIGQTIGMMLAVGVYHSDLNIHNILIDGARNPWIIDFDKCKLCTIRRRLYKKITNRLARSFEKEKILHRGLKWPNSQTDFLLDVIYKAFKANLEKKKSLHITEY